MRKRAKDFEATDDGRVAVGLTSDETELAAPVEPIVAPAAPAPQLTHFHTNVDGFFWYESASRRILDSLPTDRPTQWVEVGAFQGQSLAWLGVEVINRQLPVTIHAVDTFAGWQGTPQGAALRALFDRNIAPVAEALGERFQVHPVSSVAAAQRFTDGTVDVVWLDADHSYEAVRADIRAWLPKIRPSGTLGGDDWEMGGVARAVKEAFPASHTLGSGTRNNARWQWWMVKV